jgi:hypothetical protein
MIKSNGKITPYKYLTPKQQRFIDYHDGNSTQAAEKAEYKSPRQAGYENMTNPSIIAALASREDRERKPFIMTRQDRQGFWSRVALGKEVQDVVVGKDAEGNHIVIKVPPKMTDRLKASELLGRSEADFIEKIGIGALGADGQVKEIPLLFVQPQPKPDQKQLETPADKLKIVGSD